MQRGKKTSAEQDPYFFDVLDRQAAAAALVVEGEHRVVRLVERAAECVLDDDAVAAVDGPRMGLRANPRSSLVG